MITAKELEELGFAELEPTPCDDDYYYTWHRQTIANIVIDITTEYDADGTYRFQNLDLNMDLEFIKKNPELHKVKAFVESLKNLFK